MGACHRLASLMTQQSGRRRPRLPPQHSIKPATLSIVLPELRQFPFSAASVKICLRSAKQYVGVLGFVVRVSARIKGAKLWLPMSHSTACQHETLATSRMRSRWRQA